MKYKIGSKNDRYTNKRWLKFESSCGLDNPKAVLPNNNEGVYALKQVNRNGIKIAINLKIEDLLNVTFSLEKTLEK